MQVYSSTAMTPLADGRHIKATLLASSERLPRVMAAS